MASQEYLCGSVCDEAFYPVEDVASKAQGLEGVEYKGVADAVKCLLEVY